ncbi:MAG: hypothetical protein ACPLRY_01540 [Candidatus Bathyarchaeales archaeon]
METEYMEKVKSLHLLFEDKYSLDDFKAKLNSLPNEEKVNFANACLLYQQALKCKECKSNGPNIAMALLCICADTIKITGKRAPHENFIRFYQAYCPPELKENIPVERYNPHGNLQYSKASFEETLHLIYERFRNPFVHEAKTWFELPPERSEDGMQINLTTTRTEAFEKDSKATLYYGNTMYHITDINKFLEWFEKATLESLNNFLIEKASKRNTKSTTE